MYSLGGMPNFAENTFERDVYLPAGEWIDLNTGETIISEGQTITVSANLAQIPVYLNTASAYAEQMQEILEIVKQNIPEAELRGLN